MTQNDDRCSRYADCYDRVSAEMQWRGPEVAFGLMYSCIAPGQSILDLGIGTGLGAALFHKAGLRITGMDTSPSMTDVCRRKHPEFTIVSHDITVTPWPFDPKTFDHIVSTGVFHFIGDLSPVVAECARVLTRQGTFGFDFAEHHLSHPGEYQRVVDGIYTHRDEEYGEQLYRHSEAYIYQQLADNGFERLSEAEFLISKGQKQYFRTIVARRQ